MHTFYARLTSKPNIDGELRRRIWDERRVAIHYPFTADEMKGVDWSDPETWPVADTRSLDPTDYDRSGKRAVKALLRLRHEGGYVCAEYAGRSECLVGYVAPETPIEFIKGRWRDVERDALLKSLPLKRVRVIPRHQQPVLLAGRPQQGTICRWKKAGSLVEDLVERHDPQAHVQNLSPSLQETLCAEYLRTDAAVKEGLPRLESLVLPVGRTLRGVDFVGVAADGRRIIAQVTNYSFAASQRKAKVLAEYAGEGVVPLLFCDLDEPRREGAIEVYPLGHAFERFAETERGQRWLDGMRYFSGFGEV